MKSALISLIVAASALSAFAQHAPAKAAKTPKTIKCPVMGSTANIASATKNKMFADYKGRRYFFCCGMCPGPFKKNPAKYAKGESIPTPAAPKKKMG